MKAIYRGDRTPFIGSFILFMQSPAGWLCTLLIVFTMITTPILDKKLATARKQRLDICLGKTKKETVKQEREVALAGGRKDD